MAVLGPKVICDGNGNQNADGRMTERHSQRPYPLHSPVHSITGQQSHALPVRIEECLSHQPLLDNPVGHRQEQNTPLQIPSHFHFSYQHTAAAV